MRLAGYQGDASILSASLRQLSGALRAAGAGLLPELELDVTRAGEKASDLLVSVEEGRRHLAYMTSGYLSARVPELAVLDLPFSVSDRREALRALDGEAGALLREAVARRTGLQVLGFWDNGFRHVSNGVRPLRTPADCAGLVIRTVDSEPHRALMAALGFRAVSTDVKDLVQAVQTRAVDAQENPLTNLLGFELWRHHRHVSLTAHLFGVLLVLCPRAWFEGLPARRRGAVQRAVAEATAFQRELAAAEDLTALGRLRQFGVEVLGADEIDRAAMGAAAEPLSARQRRDLPAPLLRAYFQATTSHP